MVELSQTSSSRILSILQEKRAFTIQKVGPIQNGLREIQRDDLAEEVITFKKRTPGEFVDVPRDWLLGVCGARLKQ